MDDELKPIEDNIEKAASRPGITSVQAAALYLSGGLTDDPELATTMDRGELLNLDALQRADLRRKMGFDFEIRVQRNFIHVHSKEGPKVSTRARIQHGEINEESVNALVNACLRLKEKWEQANADKIR
jgi:hypothetical protein